MSRSAAAWLALSCGAALLTSCGKAEHDGPDCANLSCTCPDSGFQYAGECVLGKRVCRCPDAPPRTLACSFSSCTTSRGELTGSWRLVDLCARQFSSEGSCSTVSEVQGLSLSGLLDLDGGQTSFIARASIVSEQASPCGASCSAIEAGLGERSARCEAGSDGVACRCSLNYELSSLSIWKRASELSLVSADGEVLPARYCQEGDLLTVSTEAFDLSFERAGCQQGVAECSGKQVRECGPQGELVDGMTCSESEQCWRGYCAPACEPLSIYCDAQGERRCNSDGVELSSDSVQACAPGVACVNGAGCQGEFVVELGHPSGDSLDNVAFAGAVLQIHEEVTLASYSFEMALASETTLEWRVYEAPAATGPFELVFSANSNGSPEPREHVAEEIALQLVEGNYYLLGVGVPKTVNFATGGIGTPGPSATPLGVIWRQLPPSSPFSVAALADVPQALAGRARLYRD
jgi:hypothetical protein